MVYGLSIVFALSSPVAAEQHVDHSAWGGLLHRYVKAGLVDYEGLKAERETLDRYLASLADVDPATWPSREEQLVFWINAYNACVFKGVLDHYPLKSVKDVKGFFDKLRYRVAGRDLTLNEIEAEGRALRDWRIHFAVVCASASCPPIRSEAYAADRLDAQLTEQVRQFLKNSRDGLRLESPTLFMSSIFKWYAKDFVSGPETAASLLAVLEPHLDPAVAEAARGKQLALKFLPYDWSLNIRRQL